jgi:hypothetical protein
MSAAFCSRCGKPLPAGAAACPACGAATAAPPAAGPSVPAQPARPPRDCLRCHVPMQMVGSINLRSTSWGVVSDPITGTSQRPVDSFHPFSLYYCGTCGRFDLYYPGT